MIDRTVRDNTVSIKGTKCEITISTLSPEKILLRLSGNDNGELGRIPFDELNHHLDSKRKTELFIDTSPATGVSAAVTDQWEKWFAEQHAKLSKVHLFAPAKFFFITAGMIKELSGSGEMFQIYSDRDLFDRALGNLEWLTTAKQYSPVEKGPGSLHKQQFEGVLSAFQFVRLRPGVLFVKISGRDTGDTMNEVLQVLTTEINTFPGPLQIFIDASETRGVTSHVSENWTKWIADHKSKLLGIDVLTGSRLVTLIISAAKIFSRTGDLMNVMDKRPEFLQKMEAAAPGSEKLIAND